MAKQTIFSDNIEVPAVVQRKAEKALLDIKKKGNNTMKNKRYKNIMIKIVSTAAALAVVATGVFVYGNRNEDVVTPIDKAFTLQVQAAALDVGKQVALVSTEFGDSYVLSGTDGDGINYCIETPFSVEGENIDSITYSINKGAIQVIEPKDDSIVIEGEEYEGGMNTGSIGGDFDEVTGECLSVSKIYTAITVDYDKQTDAHTWFSICDTFQATKEDIEAVWGESTTKENIANVYNKMIQDAIITCTVNYIDGTSKETEISIGSKVMTYAEAGEQDAIDANAEDAFFTFELLN